MTRGTVYAIVYIMASKKPKRLIMVIEDDRTLQFTLRTVLEKAGYEVLSAESAEDASKQLKTHRPDLVYLDILLPGMSGLDLLEKMRAQKSLQSTPVFILTQFHNEEYRRRARDLKAMHYFVKAEYGLAEIMKATSEALVK